MQLLISSVCLALTSVVIGNAYHQKKQFYPAVVYITKSNASMAVIYIQFFVIVFMFGKLLRKIFLGTLRAAEFEHLLERFWYALTETCLAFTVFRDDFNPRFVALFTVLLFLKSFHWLAEERVDFMERSPVLGLLFHIRVSSLLLILGVLDYMLLMHAYNSTLVRVPTVQLVFGFEYAILLTMVASTAIKYILHAIEMRTDTPWENKAVFLLYTELVIGLVKVILYVLFVVIMAKIYALPMFVFRPMFFTIRNFKKALSDVIMSRRAIRNMNTLYPDATPEELRQSDNICIICREDMVSHSKKLPCGHIFHTTCLRSWFQRQQTCPTCRLNILRAPSINSTAIHRQEEAAPEAVPAPAAAQVATANIGNLANATQAPNTAQSPSNIELPRPDTTMSGVFAHGTPPNFIPPFTASPDFHAIPVAQPSYITPPPIPFIAPYAMPPPPMPPDLTTFTDEELKVLESTERRGVEERIKLLRNIQVMLDAANVLMSNYNIITANMHIALQSGQEPCGGNITNPTTVGTDTVDDDVPCTSRAAAAAATATAAVAAAAAAAAAEANVTKLSVSPTNSPHAATNVNQTAHSKMALNASQAASLAADRHNEVTIEDIGGEEHEFYQPESNHSPSNSMLITPRTNQSETQEDSSQLSELRKRRLKFLQEHTNASTSTD